NLSKEISGLSKSQALALISCYQPLYKVSPDKQDLRSLSSNSDRLARLIKTQYLDPIEEEKIKTSLKTFGTFENEISKNVQAQYEKTPSPRWISIINHKTPNDSFPGSWENRYKPWKILIAGCGTGRHALATAAVFPNGKITAIDLSRASL